MLQGYTVIAGGFATWNKVMTLKLAIKRAGELCVKTASRICRERNGKPKGDYLQGASSVDNVSALPHYGHENMPMV